MVMFLDTLQGLKKLYVEKMKKKVILGCRNEVWSLLESINQEQDLFFLKCIEKILISQLFTL